MGKIQAIHSTEVRGRASYRLYDYNYVARRGVGAGKGRRTIIDGHLYVNYARSVGGTGVLLGLVRLGE